MNKTLLIFGRHPAISRAEIAAVYPHAQPVARGADWGIYDIDPSTIDITRLGGVVKVAELFAGPGKLDTTAAAEALADHHTGGKLSFGASCHGMKFGSLKTLLIGIKKQLARYDLTARFANKNFQNLSSAQVQLQELVGHEILGVSPNAKDIYMARTVAVQPFQSFAARDYDKTARDARVGMLPPKLALMMVNIGVATAGEASVYDPFCGTGTVLIEASRLGRAVLGSDISPDMVAATTQNLATAGIVGQVWLHDAKKRAELPSQPVVVTEGYLGPPQTSLPPEHVRHRTFGELGQLYAQFFSWVGATRVVLTLPAYLEAGQPRHFSSKIIQPLIERAGWQRIDDGKMVYHRPDQIVGRELTVWERM